MRRVLLVLLLFVSLAGCASGPSAAPAAAPAPAAPAATAASPGGDVPCPFDIEALDRATGLQWAIKPDSIGAGGCTVAPSGDPYKTLSLTVMDLGANNGTSQVAGARQLCKRSVQEVPGVGVANVLCIIRSSEDDLLGFWTTPTKIAQIYTINGAPRGTNLATLQAWAHTEMQRMVIAP